MEIRRTTSQDKDFIGLVDLLDAELMERDGEDHAFYSQFHQTMKLEHCVVIFKEDTPVACGAFLPVNDLQVEIKRMYTRPRFRGQGLGMLVMDELEEWATELAFQSCLLETGLRQPEAIALYKKCGYQTIPNYGPYVGVENSVCFEKHL